MSGVGISRTAIKERETGMDINWKNEAEKHKRLYEQQIEVSRTLKADVGVIRESLRDQFAMATMQGLYGSPDLQGVLLQMAGNEDVSKEDQAMQFLAGIAYKQADAMLKVREVQP
jgi:hypothetical protein